MMGLLTNKITRLRLFPALALFLAVPLVAPSAMMAQHHSHDHSHGKPQTVDATKNKVLSEKALAVLDAARAGDYAKVRSFASPQLAEQLSVEDIKRIWDNLIATTGPVEKVVKTRVTNTINADLVIINTQFQKETGEFIVTFNPQGQVVGIDFPAVGSIDKIAQIVVQSLADNDFVRARGYLNAFLKTEIYPQQIQGKWQDLLKSTGDFKQIKNITVRPGSSVDRTDVVLVTVEFAKITEDIFVIFDENRRVVGIDIPQESL